MRVFFFIEDHALALKDSVYQHQNRCSCKARGNIWITIIDGKVADARCRVCSRAYDVIVEGGLPSPVDPNQIIVGDVL